jgi:hypothetical protein
MPSLSWPCCIETAPPAHHRSLPPDTNTEHVTTLFSCPASIFPTFEPSHPCFIPSFSASWPLHSLSHFRGLRQAACPILPALRRLCASQRPGRLPHSERIPCVHTGLGLANVKTHAHAQNICSKCLWADAATAAAASADGGASPLAAVRSSFATAMHLPSHQLSCSQLLCGLKRLRQSNLIRCLRVCPHQWMDAGRLLPAKSAHRRRRPAPAQLATGLQLPAAGDCCSTPSPHHVPGHCARESMQAGLGML